MISLDLYNKYTGKDKNKNFNVEQNIIAKIIWQLPAVYRKLVLARFASRQPPLM
jgi:hypothetical protein